MTTPVLSLSFALSRSRRGAGRVAGLLLVLGLAACAGPAGAPVSTAIGPGAGLALAQPDTPLIPTVRIAEAAGWPPGRGPTPAAGLSVGVFAAGLDHPRSLHVLPNGDVLVAETNAPSRPDDEGGVFGFIQKEVMKRAGAVTPSANRISILRDADSDGRAEIARPFLTGLNSPFGMALSGGRLYVANTDGIISVPYQPGALAPSGPAVRLTDLPAGPRNHHWTKDLAASPDGTRLYASVGSNSNIGEHGEAEEAGRAAIWEIDPASGARRLYATGLRNPNGLAFEPETGVLWAAVNERDELGPNLVPDYITSVVDGAFYGWPWSYFGSNEDVRVRPRRPEMAAKARIPDFAVGAHTASLGLAFASRARLGAEYASGAFVGQHGSWNRNPFAGYKVIFVPFEGGQAKGPARDVLTGFIDAERSIAFGRPVGVAIAADGALLVADDVGNVVWRVTQAPR